MKNKYEQDKMAFCDGQLTRGNYQGRSSYQATSQREFCLCKYTCSIASINNK